MNAHHQSRATEKALRDNIRKEENMKLNSHLALQILDRWSSDKIHKVVVGEQPEPTTIYCGLEDGVGWVLIQGLNIQQAWQGEASEMEERFKHKVREAIRSIPEEARVDQLSVRYSPCEDVPHVEFDFTSIDTEVDFKTK